MSYKKDKLAFLGRASFLILILPYLVIIAPGLILSPLTSIVNIIVFILTLTLISIFYVKLFNPVPNRIYLHILFNSIILTVFYYDSIFLRIYNSLNFIFIKQEVSLGYVIPTVFVLSFGVQFFFRKHIKLYTKVINVFFLIFFLNTLFYKYNQNKLFFVEKVGHYKPLDIKPNIGKVMPTILLIVDEYASPDDLYNHYRDSAIFNFSNFLTKNNWNVTQRNYSYDTMTITSLASIFNFNFNKTDEYISSYDYSGQRLIKSELYDSLMAKGCAFYNYGIFDIGDTKVKYDQVYLYAKNFTQQALNRSLFNRNNFLNDNENGDHFRQNSYILDSCLSKLSQIKRDDFVVYMHLLMPHQPYSFGNEFRVSAKQTQRNIENYYAYWKFSNTKLLKLVTELIKDNRYKIILTGDHGFRRVNEVPTHYTFTAFYGYDSSQLTNLKSVQDIGSLINASY